MFSTGFNVGLSLQPPMEKATQNPKSLIFIVNSSTPHNDIPYSCLLAKSISFVVTCDCLSVDGVTIPMLFNTSSSPISLLISAIRRASLNKSISHFSHGFKKANQPATEVESTYRLGNTHRPKDQIHLFQREPFCFRDG